MLRNKITKYLFYSNLGVWGIGSDYKYPDKGVIQSERRGLADIPKQDGDTNKGVLGESTQI